MNRSVQYIFCDGYFGGIHFYLFLNNKILNLQPVEADGYKKLLITMSGKTDSCENLLLVLCQDLVQVKMRFSPS